MKDATLAITEVTLSHPETGERLLTWTGLAPATDADATETAARRALKACLEMGGAASMVLPAAAKATRRVVDPGMAEETLSDTWTVHDAVPAPASPTDAKAAAGTTRQIAWSLAHQVPGLWACYDADHYAFAEGGVTRHERATEARAWLNGFSKGGSFENYAIPMPRPIQEAMLAMAYAIGRSTVAERTSPCLWEIACHAPESATLAAAQRNRMADERAIAGRCAGAILDKLGATTLADAIRSHLT